MDDFAAWLLSAQGITANSLTPEQLALFRQDYGEAVRKDVAIQEGDDLGLTFWIKRSAKGDIFLLYPRDRETDPHASYHRDGTYHQKSYRQATAVQKRQPLDSNFRGAEHLGTFGGHGAGPRINDTSAFDDVLVAPPGVLHGKGGCIVVDLVEPGARTAPNHREMMRIVGERIYQDCSPWIVVAIAASRNELPQGT
jgi:hypothetical protein